MQDKKIDEIIKILSPLGDHFFLVPVNPPRGEAPDKLAEKLKIYNKPAVSSHLPDLQVTVSI